MFSALKTVVYIQISPERLTLKNLKTGESIAEIPELAISAPPKNSPAPEDAKVWYFNHDEGEAFNLEVEFIPWLAQYAAIDKSEA